MYIHVTEEPYYGPVRLAVREGFFISNRIRPHYHVVCGEGHDFIINIKNNIKISFNIII